MVSSLFLKLAATILILDVAGLLDGCNDDLLVVLVVGLEAKRVAGLLDGLNDDLFGFFKLAQVEHVAVADDLQVGRADQVEGVLDAQPQRLLISHLKDSL